MRAFFDRLPITFTPQALFYPILLIASLLFAQGLKMPISHTLFVFVLLLPLGSVIQLILARLTLRVYFRASSASGQKKAPLLVYAVIKNRCVLPFSLVEASLTLPDKSGERLEDCRFVLSLLPLSSCRIERSAEFAFRGEYRIGVNCIYVYDYFRAIRLRIPTKCRADIFVMPRKLTLEPRESEMLGDIDSPLPISVHGSDNTELADIRTYEIGDSKKFIHWKLSTKSEELLVKDFCDDNGNSSTVLCDLEPFTTANESSSSPRVLRRDLADTADLYCADLVIETALAAVKRELDAKNPVILGWFERGKPVFVHLRTEADLDIHFKRFAAAKSDNSKHQILKLAEAIGNESLRAPVIVSAVLDGDYATDYLAAAGLADRKYIPELRLCAAPYMFSDSEAEETLREHIKELENEGFDVIVAQNI